VDDILYVVGGSNGSFGFFATLEAYDPATGSWRTTLAPMPTARVDPAAGVVNGVLYVVGGFAWDAIGRTISGHFATVEAYDPATNSWTTVSPMPTARSGSAAGVINGILYVVGGWNDSGGILATVEAYDPVTDTWSTMDPMPTARNALGAGVIDGRLYVPGGGGYAGTLAMLEVFTPPDLVVSVDIDIKPGSDPNSINLSSAGVIPVAILSSETFDATTVDPDTVCLAGARVKMVGKGNRFLCHEEDIDGDGWLDLVCQVYTAQFMIEPGESVAVLEAETFDGTPIRGEDAIRIVPDE
jgi:N-acetylneuraminic acid mutarotase